MPSDWRGVSSKIGVVPSVPNGALAVGPRRRAPQLGRRSPLSRVWKQISYLIGDAKRAGQTERAAVLIEVIKIIAAQQQRQK
jgi:hypothetical protein